MDSNWVKLYTSSVAYKAELIKGYLIDNDIPAVVVNKKDSSYLFGELEVYVPSDKAIVAKRLITQHEEI